jgi:hypothetical protein
MSGKGIGRKLTIRVNCIIAAALIIVSFNFPFHTESVIETGFDINEEMERREWFLWGERLTIRPDRPEIRQSTDILFSPYDDTAPMFAVTLSAVLAVIFLLLGAFYFKKVDIGRLKLDFPNPFKQYIYIVAALILVYMTLINYLFFIYRAFGDIVLTSGIYLMMGSIVLAMIALATSMSGRKKIKAKPVVEPDSLVDTDPLNI